MKRLRQFMLLTGSFCLLLLPKIIVNACGFYVAPGEYRFWLLQPDLANSSDLTPFFFASTYLYKGEQYSGSQPHLNENIEEWHQQLNGKASKADINTILYSTDPSKFFEETKNNKPKNSFINALQQPQHKELYEYLLLSKKVEDIAAHPDPWEEEVFPVPNIVKVIEEAKLLHNQTKSPFIKLRSAYQLTRLYSYNGETNEIAKTYGALIAPVKTNSWIKTAALFQKAINDSAESDYLLSKVFDRGNYNRVSCLVRFNSSNLSTVLKKAKNTHERTVINAMKVFNYPGRSLNYIRSIYQGERGYKDLPFLLLREINKVEDWLVTPKVTEFRPAVYNGQYWYYEDYDAMINYNQDKVYAKQLYNFILQVIAQKKNNTTLLQLYASHLALLQGNYNASSKHLASINPKGLPANVLTQIRVNKLLLALQAESAVNTEIENELLSIVSTPNHMLGIYDPAIMKDQLILYVGRKLIEKGEKAKGLLLLSKTRRALGQLPIGTYKDVYQYMEELAQPADYNKIIEIIDKKSKTPFEEFVAGKKFGTPAEYYEYYEGWDSTKWDKNKILDSKASWYIRNNHLDSALQTLQLAPDSFWKKEPYRNYIGGNPFYLNIYRPHRRSKNERVNYNKKEAVAKMLNLLDLAKQDPSKAAECFFQLANAYYNMSWHGKNWLMVKQWWSLGEMNNYDTDIKRTAFNNIYYGCTIAKEYYLKALKETKDNKLATLCCYMAGKCNDNYQQYLWNIKNKGNYNVEYTSSPDNPYVKTLKQKGIDVNYYKELVKECETYQSYIKQYNKLL